MLSGVKRGSYDIASFNALLSASPWPHSLAWLKEVHGAGGTRIGWKGVLLCWKRDGIYSIHVKAPSWFHILNLCFWFVYYEVKWCWNLLVHKPTCIARSKGPEESLTSWPLSALRQVKQWHLEPSIVSFNGIIETMKRAQEWKPGLARWVRLGCLGCFDVEDLQPQFFQCRHLNKGKLCWFSITFPLHIAEIR